MKYFRPNLKWARNVGLLFIVLLAIATFDSLSSLLVLSLIMTTIIVFFVIYLLYKKYTYFLIQGNNLAYTVGSFSKHKCGIMSIISIENKHVDFALSYLSINYSENGKTKTITPDPFFSPDTLSELIRELKHINPNIELDKEVQKMLEQGKGKNQNNL